MRFDIEAVKQRSMDNPVSYVQYGHARIASILRNASEAGVTLLPIGTVVLSILVEPAETELLKALADVPAVIGKAATLRAPHRVAHASQDLAARFHRFARSAASSPTTRHETRRACGVPSSGTVLANLLGSSVSLLPSAWIAWKARSRAHDPDRDARGGTVGSAVAVLAEHGDDIAMRAGSLAVTRVAVRDGPAGDVPLPREVFTTDADSIVADPDIEVSSSSEEWILRRS